MLKTFHFFILLAILFVNCTKSNPEDSVFSINRHHIDKYSFEIFREVTYRAPTIPDKFFPGSRPPITHMVETEAIYRSASRKLKKETKNSLYWKWTENFYLAQNYTTNVLIHNLGFLDEEVEDYYNANVKDFTKTITNEEGVDSTVQLSYEEAKSSIVNKLFLENNKPDSAFIASLPDSIAQDSAKVANRWVYHARSGIQDFFMRKLFQEKYGYPYSDTLSNLVGEDGIIKPQDVELIRIWDYNNQFSEKELVEWLLRWKLFAEKAKSTGFDHSERMKVLMDWAWKLEVARVYVTEKLLPKFEADLKLDSSLARYAVYDRTGNTREPDSALYVRELSNMKNTILTMKIDSSIHRVRSRYDIEFHQSDWMDERDKDPSEIFEMADSLKEEGKTDEALKNYKLLTDNFLFTDKGKQALIEAAKLETDKENYLSAVKNYRKFQTVNSKGDCNSFFMLGYIYDENMRKPDLAEVNYRWIIKNAPECDLAQDTEFMLLHLDEQMSSITIEELQAQTVRQNRKLDFDENAESPSEDK